MYADKYIEYLNSRLRIKKNKSERNSIKSKIDYMNYCKEQKVPFLLDSGKNSRQRRLQKFNKFLNDNNIKKVTIEHFLKVFKIFQTILIERYDEIYFIDANKKASTNCYSAVKLKEIGKKERVFNKSIDNTEKVQFSEVRCAEILIDELNLKKNSNKNNIVVLTDSDSVYWRFSRENLFWVFWIPSKYNLAHIE